MTWCDALPVVKIMYIASAVTTIGPSHRPICGRCTRLPATGRNKGPDGIRFFDMGHERVMPGPHCITIAQLLPAAPSKLLYTPQHEI